MEMRKLLWLAASAALSLALTSGAMAAPGSNPAPAAPPIAFVAYQGATVADATGSSSYQVVANDTLINTGNAYSATTGVFTAPVAGLYMFSGSAIVGNLGSSNILGYIYLVWNVANIQSQQVNPYAGAFGNVYGLVLPGVVLPLAKNDTVKFVVSVGGAASNTVSVVGGSSPYSTYFSGVYLGPQ